MTKPLYTPADDWTHNRPGGNHCPECKHGLGSAAWCQWCGWNRPDDEPPIECRDGRVVIKVKAGVEQ